MAKILLIDDDPVILSSLRRQLALAGHEVLTASGGHEGVSQVRRSSPDLVITDLTMPEGDGYEVVEAIRADEALKRTPIVMLTARGDVEERVKGLKRGADDYVPKPFSLQELLARVHALLRMRDLQTQAMEAERLKALLEMAGAAAHEINQPLTVIMGYADLMLRKVEEQDPFRPFLVSIKENTAQIANILKKFQAIRRYESKTYLDEIKILDLEKSTKKAEDG